MSLVFTTLNIMKL